MSNTPLPDPLPGASRPRLRVNPAVIVGLGDFGGVALRRLSERLRAHHPALLERSGWLRLTTSGWREPLGAETTTSGPYDAAPLHAPVNIAPAPLARALDEATSQATVSALQQAGYDPSARLDTIFVAHADEALAREALWLLLDLLRAQPPLRQNRLTLILACDSRRFSGPLALELGRFFDQLSQRLVSDRAAPAPGSIHWCYLCDVLDVDSRLLGDEGKDAVQSQAELIEGFMALLLASNLRRDRAYARTALPELAHDASAPPDAALVSSFSLGALVLPVDQIVALARDQLALRLHAAAFPIKSSVTDRDTGWSARERLLASVDLSPQGLRARLLRGPDDAPLRFDAAPPDLSGMDPDTLLQGLARWRNALQTRWDQEGDSPPAHITRNADALLDGLREQVQLQVDRMLQDSPRGLHQALAFLDELPQAIERAQVQLVADDGPFLEKAIPSADQKFRELGKAIMGYRWRWEGYIVPMGIAVFFLVIKMLEKSATWPFYLVVAGLMVYVLLVSRWRRPRYLAKRQTDFIAAVRLKFQSLQEREMRAGRRGVLDKLSQAVRQERQALLGWRETLAAARDVLAQAKVPPFQAICGERPLCDPAEYPSPIPAYDKEKIAAIAAHYLDPGTRPYRREEQAQAIADWLRQGAERALAAWRESLTVSAWSGADAAQALGELAARPG
jgi:hypothetical protein